MCKGHIFPVGSSRYGFRKNIGNLHAYLRCSGVSSVVSNPEKQHLSFTPLPSNDLAALTKWSVPVIDQHVQNLEGNMLVFVSEINDALHIDSPEDLGSCTLNLRGCAASIGMPGGGIANFHGDETVGIINFPTEDTSFGQRLIIMDRDLFSVNSEEHALAELKTLSAIHGANLIDKVHKGTLQNAADSWMDHMKTIITQTVCRVSFKLVGPQGCGLRGGVYADPVFIASDLAGEGFRKANMVGKSAKMSADKMSHKSKLLASQEVASQAAFLETGLGSKWNISGFNSTGQVNSLLTGLKKTMESSEGRLDKVLSCLEDGAASMTKWSNILIDSNRLYHGYGVATDKYTRLVDKGQYWNQEALDAVEKAMYGFESTVNAIEEALSKAEKRLHACKGTLPTERFLFHKVAESAKRFRKNSVSDTRKIEEIVEMESKLMKKWKKANAIAEWDRAAVRSYQQDASPPITLMQLTDSAGIAASLAINAKTALAMHTLVQEREELHAKGLAEERVESDQWQELQEQKINVPGAPNPLGAEQKKLVKVLSHTLTFELAELLTRKIVPQLNSELTQELIDKIARIVPKKVAHDITSGLTVGLETTVSALVPTVTNRLLPIAASASIFKGLVNILTRGLTHTLAPTLTYTLSMSNDERVYCHHCYHFGNGCEHCKHTSQLDRNSFSALNYYASYYSDYYSSYFADRDMGHQGPKDGSGVVPNLP